MDDTQREPRVTESDERSEDHREHEVTAVAVGRMLANPRRIRRN